MCKTARQWPPPRRGTAIQPDSKEGQPSCPCSSRHRSSRLKKFLACHANYRHMVRRRPGPWSCFGSLYLRSGQNFMRDSDSRAVDFVEAVGPI